MVRVRVEIREICMVRVHVEIREICMARVHVEIREICMVRVHVEIRDICMARVHVEIREIVMPCRRGGGVLASFFKRKSYRLASTSLNVANVTHPVLLTRKRRMNLP